MSRNASGVYSLPSAVNPVVSLTTITTNWANTTLSDIGSEITNSLDRSGRGAMTAPLQLPDGSASLPSLTFANDLNTGLYRTGADSLGLTTGGTVRVTIGTSALTIAAALQASDGAVGAPAYSFSGDTNTGIYRAGADDLRIAAGGVDIAKATTKLSASAATAATGGTRQDALSLTNGDLDLSAVTAPDSTTSLANRLTALNFIKAWACININGATFTPTVDAGFNITSVSRVSAAVCRVTFGGDFSSVNYGVWAMHLGAAAFDDTIIGAAAARATTHFDFQAFVASGAGTPFNLDGLVNSKFFLAFIGAQ